MSIGADKAKNGRFLIGEPTGTFYEKPRIARQPGKMSHRSDWAADIVRVDNTLVMAASLRGSMHYGLGTIRQDSFAIGSIYGKDDCQWVIAVVADGVSSAAQSHTFADYMARQTALVVESELSSVEQCKLSNVDWNDLAKRLVEISEEFCRSAAKKTVSDEKSEEVDKAEPRDFVKKWATTLEFIIVQVSCDESSSEKEYVHVTVAGDGAAYILKESNIWEVIKSGKQQTGAIASNAVLSLPLSPDEFTINTGKICKEDFLIITTDGLSDFIGDGASPLGDFFKCELPNCESLISFLQIVDVSLYQADDDRTIILIKETE